MHAEICPVCKGSGKYENNPCHGCNGKGWVEVGGYVKPSQEKPIEWPPARTYLPADNPWGPIRTSPLWTSPGWPDFRPMVWYSVTQ